MWPHIFRFLGLKGAHATVRFGDGPIRFSSDVLHRKNAAVEARNAVLELCGVCGDAEEIVLEATAHCVLAPDGRPFRGALDGFAVFFLR